MRAVVVAGPRRLAVEQVPDPTPEPGQVVLRVSACGICGSDLHVHQAGFLPPGAIMGHEFCGEVMERAGSLRAGDRVCALPVLSCGRCERCRSGLGAYCAAQRALGFGQAAGAYAEYVAAAEHETVRLPDGVDDESAALVEPLAVGLHAVEVGRVQLEAALHFVLAYEKHDFQRTVELLDQGRLQPSAMVTDRIGLAAVPDAFTALERPTDQCKVLVRPGI